MPTTQLNECLFDKQQQEGEDQKQGLFCCEEAWSSLVEGDEQLDRPASQTCMEYCHVGMCCIMFFGFYNTTAYHLGRYSLHLHGWGPVTGALVTR